MSAGVKVFQGSGNRALRGRLLVRRVQLVGAVRWTPVHIGERHAVTARDDGSSRLCGSAVGCCRCPRPYVCDVGPGGAPWPVAVVMRPVQPDNGARRCGIGGFFGWWTGEGCGANLAWMSMRRRLITRALTKRVVSRRSVPRRTCLHRNLAWHGGFDGLVVGLDSRCRATSCLHAGRSGATPPGWPLEERA